MWRLVQHLPDDARFFAAVAADEGGPGTAPDVAGWPRTDRLLASVVDELAIANWQRAGGKRNRKPTLLTAAPKKKPARATFTAMSQQQVLDALQRMGGDRYER